MLTHSYYHLYSQSLQDSLIQQWQCQDQIQGRDWIYSVDCDHYYTCADWVLSLNQPDLQWIERSRCVFREYTAQPNRQRTVFLLRFSQWIRETHCQYLL